MLVSNVEERLVKMVKKDKHQPLYFAFNEKNRLKCFVHHRKVMIGKDLVMR